MGKGVRVLALECAGWFTSDSPSAVVHSTTRVSLPLRSAGQSKLPGRGGGGRRRYVRHTPHHWRLRLVSNAKTIGVGMMVTLLCVSCGSSGSTDKNAHGWQLVSVESPRILKVGREVGYCVGDPWPTIRPPQIQYRGKNVYIKLRVKMPRRRPSKGGLCLDREMLITRIIVLRRDLKDVSVYDSGVQPPELRWPSE